MNKYLALFAASAAILAAGLAVTRVTANDLLSLSIMIFSSAGTVLHFSIAA